MLKMYHSAAKALEIIIDAKRKNKYAIGWIRAIRYINR